MRNKADAIPSDLSNVGFYDQFSDNYDNVINAESSNKEIRLAVRNILKTNIESGALVMDFGGGTGADLSWLTEEGYQVVLCEPSSGMRSKATHLTESLPHKDQVTILNDSLVDFNNWVATSFTKKFDAILANLAVFNCIENIDALFNQLALAVKSGGSVFSTVLDTRISKIYKAHPKQTLYNLILRKPIKIVHFQDGFYQPVYLHRKREMISAAEGKFELKQSTHIGFGFNVLEWERL